MRSAAAFVATRCEPVGQAGRFGQPVLAGEAPHQVGRGCHRDTVAGRDDQWIAVDLASQDPAQLRSIVPQRRLGSAPPVWLGTADVAYLLCHANSLQSASAAELAGKG